MRIVAPLAGCLLLAACASPTETNLSSAAADRASTVGVDLDACSRTYLTTVFADQLVAGVAAPLDEPYFIDSDPSSGEGYEAGLVYGVAAELGLPDTGVVWQFAAPDALPQEIEVDFIIDRDSSREGPSVEYSVPYLDDGYALAFAPGNPLIACVNRALDAMAANGELDRLAQTWMD